MVGNNGQHRDEMVVALVVVNNGLICYGFICLYKISYIKREDDFMLSCILSRRRKKSKVDATDDVAAGK